MISIYDVYDYVQAEVTKIVPKVLLSEDDCVQYFKDCLTKGIDSDEMLLNELSIREYIDEAYWEAIEHFVDTHNRSDIDEMICDIFNIDDISELPTVGLSWADTSLYSNDIPQIIYYLLAEEYPQGSAYFMIMSDLGFIIEDKL